MITKSMVLPFISVLALLLQSVFHVTLSEDLQGQIATAIADIVIVGVNIYGIIKNHHTPPPEPPQTPPNNNPIP